MWQDDIAFEAFADCGFGFVIVDSQRHDMCYHPGDSPRVEAAHGQDTSKNGIFISIWKVSTADHQT